MKKRVVPSVVGVASVWFVTHAGGGFCTGRQEVEFFVRYGQSAVFMPFLAMALLALLFFFSWELARAYQVYNYRALANKLYQPHHQVLGSLFEAGFLLTALLASSAGIAAGGHLGEEMFKIPYLLGITLTVVIVFILVIWGPEFVRNASALISLLIIGTLIAIMYVCLPKVFPESIEVIRTVNEPGWGWNGFLYSMFQVWALGTYIAVSEVLKTRKQVAAAAFVGFCANSVMLFLICLLLLGYHPQIIDKPLPLLFVIENLGGPVLRPWYCLALFLGNISTAVALIFGSVKRFESMWKKGPFIFQHFFARRITITLVALAAAWLISNFGLIKIIHRGYSFVGYLAIPLIFLPLIASGFFKSRGNAQDNNA
jgi:uncharacterized membrane protein YkvI